MRSFASVCERVVSAVLGEPAPQAAERPPAGNLRLAMVEEHPAPACAMKERRIPGEVCLDLCGDRLQAEVPGMVLDVAAFDALREAKDNPLHLCEFSRTCTGARSAAMSHGRGRGQPQAVIGDYLATLAQGEATCAASFTDLAGELSAHGAPVELVERARAAQDDDRVHVVLVGRMAMRHGATPATAPRRRSKPRSLAAFACRNAAEGCGAEAFHAVATAWASRTARDLSMRALARHLAADEARHADLAFDVHAWAIERLAARKVARLREIRDAAIRSAAREATSPAVQSALGTPSPAVAEQLAERLIAELAEP
jgi:hypothetical protein